MNYITHWLLLQKHLIRKGHEPEWIEIIGRLYCMTCEKEKHAGKGGGHRSGLLQLNRVPQW
jgi:hypothetical protein